MRTHLTALIAQSKSSRGPLPTAKVNPSFIGLSAYFVFVKSTREYYDEFSRNYVKLYENSHTEKVNYACEMHE
jgi:hypothetical protein